MKVSEIHWQERKSQDGRVAKIARLQFNGIGWQEGGRIMAMVDAALAESAPGGASKWALKWQPPRSGLKPLTASGEAACLESAELCMEEAILAFTSQIEAWSKQYAGIRSGLGFTGFLQVR
jgi:hypothetical protein